MTGTSGRAVLVTGASRGIGRAIAKAFAANGDRVAVNYRTNDKLAEALVDELPGEGHLAVQADIADPDAVQRLVDTVAKAFGRIDVLVNNAGVFVDHPILSSSYQDWQAAWRAELDINLVGAANVTWCAVRHMSAGGRVVNMSSRGAYRGELDCSGDAASKAGLTAFGQTIALELAPRGIAVASVAPGWVETEMTTDYVTGPGADAIMAQSPFGRVAQPDEVAGAVLYLASPGAEWASGAVLHLNGASYLRC
ncbi:SDR family oxidoreductase [Micromonospora sp. PLK6-60]|uniref:SDR family NAD(P)-dependent oxidoreductase n=1 Tax=Micromonospora sp. PLK6-60 TaxID=2873383 RepID=UPI001CA62EF5|nr:SDR family oxidoreductase [Micromonospora sp. PLK6-60]MBY8870776.1 SDR family oxidoreductase [Micromonospora sp. PLK6-60]